MKTWQSVSGIILLLLYNIKKFVSSFLTPYLGAFVACFPTGKHKWTKSHLSGDRDGTSECGA